MCNLFSGRHLVSSSAAILLPLLPASFSSTILSLGPMSMNIWQANPLSYYFSLSTPSYVKKNPSIFSWKRKEQEIRDVTGNLYVCSQSTSLQEQGCHNFYPYQKSTYDSPTHLPPSQVKPVKYKEMNKEKVKIGKSWSKVLSLFLRRWWVTLYLSENVTSIVTEIDGVCLTG